MSTLFLFLFILHSNSFTSSITTISNVEPRYDTSGNIVDAHDGCLVKFNDTYYLYGTVYTNCTQSGPVCNGQCGYFPNLFAVYSSKDLMKWNLLSNNILPALSIDNNRISYWMPNVGYNSLTKQYIMIYWSGHYGFINNKVAIAVSDTVYGPFKNIEPISMSGCKIISDTVSLFIDNDNSAYIRYNTRDSPLRHVIEKLTPNWLNTTMESSIIFSKQDFPWYDGGGTFYVKENNKYYTMLGSDCCFCQWGGDSLVFIADNSPLNQWNIQNRTFNPIGSETNYCSNNSIPDWSLVTNMNINPCSPYNNDIDLMNFTLPSQQFSVSKLITNNGTLFMYNGEHFKSSNDGLKSHDLQTWIPLEFDNDGNMLPMKWQNEWTVELATD